MVFFNDFGLPMPDKCSGPYSTSDLQETYESILPEETKQGIRDEGEKLVDNSPELQEGIKEVN